MVASFSCSQCGARSEQPFTYCPVCGTRTLPPQDHGSPGRILNGKYRILAEIGAGSMGTVYLSEHTALKKKVVLKILHKELQLGEDALKRFQREGIAAGQVNHPNAIQIFDFDRAEDGSCYLAMEHVDGENLRQLLAREQALGAADAIDLVRQLLSTLAEAHRHGIVHRDLKPENLMVVKSHDGDLNLKVLDFGLSKLVDRRVDMSLQTMSGRVMGTPLYMAPEQWHGEDVDHRADLYAAALILYELVTGRQPFRGENLTETLLKSTTEEPPSLLDTATKLPLPVDLDAVVQRGLAKRREERFQNADEMIDALDAVRLDRVQAARSTRSRQPAAAKRRRGGRARTQHETPSRKGLWLAIGGAAAVVIAIAVVMFALPGGSAENTTPTPLVSRKAKDELSDGERGYLALLADARDQLRAGQAAAALAAADKALRQPIAATDPEGFVVRAAIYQRQGDLDAAQLDHQAALTRHPGYAEAAAGIGWIALQRGDLTAAEKSFRDAQRMDNTCADGHAGLAAVLTARQTPREALALLGPLAERFPESALFQLHLGEAQLASGDAEAATLAFTRAKRADSSLWRSYLGLALANDKKGNAEAAEQQCRAGLAIAGDVPELRRLLAELLLGRDRFDEALGVLDAAVTKDAKLLLLEGIARQGKGDSAPAIAAFERCVQTAGGESAAVHLLLAMEHTKAAAWAEVAEHAAAAARLDSSSAKAAFYQGLAAFRRDDHDAAAKHFERAIGLDGADLETRYTLGVLYMDYLERPADAAAQLRAYKAGGGADAKVDEWLRKLGN